MNRACMIKNNRGGFFGVKRHVYMYEDIEDAHLYTDKHAVMV